MQNGVFELIFHIGNTFIDLLADTANNVAISNDKKQMNPDHIIKGLQKLNLDEYIPFLTTEN